MNPYSVLGVPKTATKKQIQAAFRKLARQAHPDVGGDAERFKEIDFAYKLLMDDERRAKYDDTGALDEDKPDDSLGRILNVLSHYFVQVIKETLNGGHQPKNVDLVKRMRTLIHERNKTLEQQREELTTARKTLDECHGRFTMGEGEAVEAATEDEDDENLLECVLRAQLRGIDNDLAAFAAEEVMNQKALKFLARYKFRFDPIAHVHLALTSAMTSSTSAFGGWAGPNG